MRAAEALASPRVCADSPEHSLLADVMRLVPKLCVLVHIYVHVNVSLLILYVTSIGNVQNQYESPISYFTTFTRR